MLSFLLKFIRFMVVVSSVLLLGQVPVQGRTIGEHFSLWLRDGFKKTQEKLAKSTLVASLPRIAPRTEEEPKKKSDEAISSSDRESLLRVLQ